jgi:hypothetical protein
MEHPLTHWRSFFQPRDEGSTNYYFYCHDCVATYASLQLKFVRKFNLFHAGNYQRALHQDLEDPAEIAELNDALREVESEKKKISTDLDGVGAGAGAGAGAGPAVPPIEVHHEAPTHATAADDVDMLPVAVDAEQPQPNVGTYQPEVSMDISA